MGTAKASNGNYHQMDTIKSWDFTQWMQFSRLKIPRFHRAALVFRRPIDEASLRAGETVYLPSRLCKNHSKTLYLEATL